MKYYKILYEDMKHNNMQYKEGLNVNCEETYMTSCSHANGLFFTDAKNVFKHVWFGTKIAEVEIPENETVCFVEEGSYKAHRIILKNIRPLWVLDTFTQLYEEGVDFSMFDYKLLKKKDNYSIFDYRFATRHFRIFCGTLFDYATAENAQQITKFIMMDDRMVHKKVILEKACRYERHINTVRFVLQNEDNICRKELIQHLLKDVNIFKSFLFVECLLSLYPEISKKELIHLLERAYTLKGEEGEKIYRHLLFYTKLSNVNIEGILELAMCENCQNIFKEFTSLNSGITQKMISKIIQNGDENQLDMILGAGNYLTRNTLKDGLSYAEKHKNEGMLGMYQYLTQLEEHQNLLDDLAKKIKSSGRKLPDKQ